MNTVTFPTGTTMSRRRGGRRSPAIPPSRQAAGLAPSWSRSRSWSSSSGTATSLALLLLASLCCFGTVTEGQRAAVSLGSRLKNPFQRKRAGSADGSYVLQEEIVVQDDHVVPVGGMDHVDLAFEGVRLVLQGKNGKPAREILDGSVSGRARPGRMLAVMGPSGAGKSTAVHAVAGRVNDSPKLKMYGRRYVNGRPVAGHSLLPAAFIEQSVSFFPHMTVRETLTFRVDLKLGSRLSRAARDEMVDDLLEQVGLSKAADTVVGDNRVRGISGGERKRLSIAVEMISSPSLIFLDEPTSGLDSTAAASLVKTLQRLAASGKTVVAVIHQPSQHIFDKFDDLMVLANGRLMYYGERKDVRSYLSKHGCRASAEIGTAEHVLDCVSSDPLEDESPAEAAARIERLAAAAAEGPLDLGLEDPALEASENGNGTKRRAFALTEQRGPRANIFVQFKLLMSRSLHEVSRAKGTLLLKAVQQLSLGLIYGGIYSLGNDQSSIQDRIGLLSLITIGASNMAVAASIRSFPKEKAIVSKEIAQRMYRTLPYFLGKAISEIPLVALFNSIFGGIVYRLTGLSRATGKFQRFLALLASHGLVSEALGLVIGAISPNSDVALALFPAVLVLNIIFDGKNISIENTPRLLRWIPKVGLIRWGYEGLCLNEFEGLQFTATGPRRGPVARTGAEALSRYGLGDNDLGKVFRAQLVITAACWMLSYLGLTLTRQKFLVMRDPANGKNVGRR